MQDSKLERFPVVFDGDVVHIGTANELAVVLDVLQGNHDSLVLDQLAPHLARIVTEPKGFISTLKALAPTDQISLITALVPSLGKLLPSASNLRDTLALLADPEVEEQLLFALGSVRLRNVLRTAAQLAEVLEWVYGRSDQLLLEMLGTDHLIGMLRSGRDLSVVLLSLDFQRQEWLLRQIGWERVSGLVRTGADLSYLLRALPTALSDRLLKEFTKAQLIALIGDEETWSLLCRRLEASEIAHICGALGVDADA